jgi:hypothetical protein
LDISTVGLLDTPDEHLRVSARNHFQNNENRFPYEPQRRDIADKDDKLVVVCRMDLVVVVDI